MNMLKITKDFNPAQLASVLVNFIGFVVLLTCVLLSPHALVYDEVYHLPLVDLLNQYGLSYRFLRGTGQSAPGPLYPIIHYIFQPLTNLQAPAVRLVNYSSFITVNFSPEFNPAKNFQNSPATGL